VAFWSLISRRKPCHVSRILATTVDEPNRCDQGQDEEEEEEVEAPWLNILEHHDPKGPQQRDVEEDAVPSSHDLKTSASGTAVKHVCSILFGHQTFLNSAANTDLAHWAISMNELLTGIGARAMTAGWHGLPSNRPTHSRFFKHPLSS